MSLTLSVKKSKCTWSSIMKFKCLMTFTLKKSCSSRFVFIKPSVAVAGSQIKETCSTIYKKHLNVFWNDKCHETSHAKKLFVLHLIGFAKCALKCFFFFTTYAWSLKLVSFLMLYIIFSYTVFYILFTPLFFLSMLLEVYLSPFYKKC